MAERKITRHTTETDTFIREYHNHIPPQLCKLLCSYADDIESGASRNEKSGEFTYKNKLFGRKDFFFWLTDGTSPEMRNDLLYGWSKVCSNAYLEDFPQLKRGDFWMSAAKIQVTRPGEGFHNWHYDNSGHTVMDREFVIITYLNDDFEGGETEFLYQGVRVKPETGKTVVFPASYTHMHRGNPPIGGTKYIATTWASRLPLTNPVDSQLADEPQMIMPREQIIKSRSQIQRRDKQELRLCTPTTRGNTFGCEHIDEAQSLVCILIR